MISLRLPAQICRASPAIHPLVLRQSPWYRVPPSLSLMPAAHILTGQQVPGFQGCIPRRFGPPQAGTTDIFINKV
ncbi:hypothetical protein RCIA64 [Methanocella arvoryzae MRE50]|uniref:Uncharacterized protein n=1 Tax=Methanocella arvoryzae (strain DSM 22066 / NBRC 105507 / MRE50) TaxID=351160 RepID=Q0W591_METAR|nr:hypothetical protein RCIA64 [Methanocella arvoryzae MRE50]